MLKSKKTKRILLKKSNEVPRIYLYNIKAEERNIGISGIDYYGYIISGQNTDRPYYTRDNRRVYLSFKEKTVLKEVLAKKGEKCKVCGEDFITSPCFA